MQVSGEPLALCGKTRKAQDHLGKPSAATFKTETMAAKLLRSESAFQNAPLICRKIQKCLEVTDTFNIENKQGKQQMH